MLATEWLGLRGWARIPRKTSPPRNRSPLVGASEKGSVTPSEEGSVTPSEEGSVTPSEKGSVTL